VIAENAINVAKSLFRSANLDMTVCAVYQYVLVFLLLVGCLRKCVNGAMILPGVIKGRSFRDNGFVLEDFGVFLCDWFPGGLPLDDDFLPGFLILLDFILIFPQNASRFFQAQLERRVLARVQGH